MRTTFPEYLKTQYLKNHGPAPRAGAPGASPADADADAEGLFTLNTLLTHEEHDAAPAGTCAWPEPLDEAAYFGLAGEIVRELEPHTEADPAAMLVQLLAGFGNLIGRTAHARVGPALHHGNTFVLLIGQTSVGRKGSSWAEVYRLLAPLDPEWSGSRVVSGLSTGEGLIYHVRDAQDGKEAVKEKGRVVRYDDVIVDHGVADKRLMVVETEFARPLQAMRREGATLSAVLRQAWDGGDLRSLTKNFSATATGTHVSVVGHITADELRKLLTGADLSNGFANRFLWVACRRARLLPFGGDLDPMMFDHILWRLRHTLKLAKDLRGVEWSPEARELWQAEYPGLTRPRPGALGTVVNRAEAHALRLAMLTAAINDSHMIEVDHLKAALSLVAYSEQSAAFVLGESDSVLDRDERAILEFLRDSPESVRHSRTDILRAVFGCHKPAPYVAERLNALLARGLVEVTTIPTEGRPRAVFRASPSSSSRPA
jgi:hypothetical protein